MLLARSWEDLEKVRSACKNPDQHLVVAGDLTDFIVLEKIIKEASSFFDGEVDAVLHTVGGGLGLRSALLTAPDFMRLFTLNLLVASEINRLLIPAMKARGRGNLVHVGSIASSEGVGSVGYNTVKAGLAAYVRTLGKELASSRIVVTGILPGAFFAPGNAMDRLKADKSEVHEQFVREKLPRGFMANGQELLPFLMLLCSDDASMMGGCLVPIDAGEGRAYSA